MRIECILNFTRQILPAKIKSLPATSLRFPVHCRLNSPLAGLKIDAWGIPFYGLQIISFRYVVLGSRKVHLALCCSYPRHYQCYVWQIFQKFCRSHKWALSWDLFDKICDRLYTPDIDLFSTRLNKKLLPYESWKPNPEAHSVNAFTFCWEPSLGYSFPHLN